MTNKFEELINTSGEAAFSTYIGKKKTFGILLKNRKNMSVALTNYGARVVSLKVPDANGQLDDIILGYNSIEDYLLSDEKYFGATIGRYANRIANATFELDGIRYVLDQNDASNHLHGGEEGFHTIVWDALPQGDRQVTFRYLSSEGHAGYPGDLAVTVTYTLTDKNELVIEYEAISSQNTIINLTNHCYFNLAGAGHNGLNAHRLMINADRYSPILQNKLPSGEICSVEATPFDFRNEKAVEIDTFSTDPQIQYADGYDHNFVLNKSGKEPVQLAARVSEQNSGRVMEVLTTEPGLQFYTANGLNGKDIGREGVPYCKHSAFCLETQHFPNSPNQPNFPSVILNASKKFKSTTIFRFSTQ